MKVKVVIEISCYVENNPGIIADITAKLGEVKVFITGIQIYEGQLQSLVKLVVDNIDKTEKVLRGAGVDLISRTEILEIEIPNTVGGLAYVTKVFKENNLKIKTIYSSNSNIDVCMAYVRVDDVNLAKEVLSSS